MSQLKEEEEEEEEERKVSNKDHEILPLLSPPPMLAQIGKLNYDNGIHTMHTHVQLMTHIKLVF